MNYGDLHAKVFPSLLAGTARHPLPGNMIRPSDPNSDGALEMLSLMGQALRFEHPATPASFAVEPEIEDDREVIADHLRRPLIRLLTGRLPTGHSEKAMERTFDRLRLRPHPFDM